MTEYFADRAFTYAAETPWVRDASLARHIIDLVPIERPSGACIDLAAGPGHLTDILELQRPGPWFALDRQSEALKAHQGFSIQAGGHALPLADGSVAAVVCRSGLHYIGHAVGLLEIRRVLAPEGRAILAQKVADALEADADWYQKVQELRSVKSRERVMTSDIEEAAADAGLRVDRMLLHRGTYELDVRDWASRFGYFNEARTSALLALAESGRDPSFRARTGFILDGHRLTMPLDWRIMRLRPDGA